MSGMGSPPLNLLEVREMMIYVSRKMIESKDSLTQADKAIGDGDHGVGMARGFEFVLKIIEAREFASIDEILLATGLALMTSVGGAAGAVFGTFFRGASKNLQGAEDLTPAILSRMLQGGLQAVKKVGKASLGDKTMIDALEPAAMESLNQTSADLDEALAAVAEAARLGLEKTKGMVAKVGKAKTLGERALGHPDPGALSTYLILNFMKEFVASL
jgi:dihydroxyacetone kinase-like protein